MIAYARFDLNILADLNDVISLNQTNIQAHSLLCLVYLMRGNIQSAGVELNTAKTLYATHASHRMRNQKSAISLYMIIWSECRTNPAIEYALTEIHALPLIQQPAAIAKIFRDESKHPASAIALLIALRQLGVWEYPAPLLSPDDKQVIPRRIIQFWDSAKIPDGILNIMRSWPQICKGFDYQLFNDESAEAFLKANCTPEVQRAFHIANAPAMRADLFRLAYLSIHGGIYVDADDRCRHNLDSWLGKGYHLFLYQEFTATIGNNFLAATPRHPFIIFALETVVQNILQRQGDNICFISGPGAITTIFCRYYLNYLECGKLPPGVIIRDVYHMQTRISMHLYHEYKEGEKHWLSLKPLPIFRGQSDTNY